MADNRSTPLPEPGTLRAGAPPYLRARPGIAPVTRTFILAAGMVLLSGLILFGWDIVRVTAICVASAMLVDALARIVTGRSAHGAEGHALLLGLLTACTLPPGVFWPVPLIAAVLAVLTGQVVAGGMGNYLWHPVALGRVAVEMLFPDQLRPERWPVLAPGHLLWGDLHAAHPLAAPAAWGTLPLPYGGQAWEVVRPADVLAAAIPARADAGPWDAVAALLRDSLPPWSHTLIGVAGGAIGEACGLAAIVAGLVLMWRGLARWPSPVMAVLVAALMASILPVTLERPDGTLSWHWLPGSFIRDGLPVGVLYILYHLTAGGFLLVLMVLAVDPTSTPLTTRGHAMFGAIIGGATILLRVLMGLPASAYWALLIANTLVPAINRATRRRVFGT